VTEVSGSTSLYAVLGDPVAQVQAPALLNPLLAELGVDAVVVPMRVRPADLADALRGLTGIGNVAGLLVTVPHKTSVCELADELGPAAALSGTANALRRAGDGWLAENFDGLGFVLGLEAAGHPVRDRHVDLVGAGGAGSAIAVSLLANGAARVSVGDVDLARRDTLVTRLAARWPGRVAAATNADLASADIVVNATPLGMRPADPLPFDPAGTRAGAMVADIVMKHADTRLLCTAAALGRPTHQGIHMLRHQVSCYREFFGWAS